MPKKMGMNSKAVQARERKEAVKNATKERVAKEAEDRLWADDDKNLAKKQQRREEMERKRVETARRKAECKAQLEQENSPNPQSKLPLAKIYRQQIQEELDKKQRAIDAINAANKPPASRVVVQQEAIEENLNHGMAEVEVATNVDEALAALSVGDGKDDKHPEKRMRAAFKAFSDANLPRITAENPTLRLSQLKQILMKEWNKSPDNPFNQSR